MTDTCPICGQPIRHGQRAAIEVTFGEGNSVIDQRFGHAACLTLPDSHDLDIVDDEGA